MSSDRKPAIPGSRGYQQQGYKMQGYQPPQQGFQQQIPASPPYPSTVPALEIHHQGTEYSHLEQAEGRKGTPKNDDHLEEAEGRKETPKKDDNDSDDDDIPGRGPGGVPDKYFALEFEDCFEEHKKTKTIPVIYEALGFAYKYTKFILYHIFVILVGIPLAILWAIINGITAFILVWVWGPAQRYLIVWVYAITPAVTTPYRALLAPLVDVAGRIFRQIRIQANINGLLVRNTLLEKETI